MTACVTVEQDGHVLLIGVDRARPPVSRYPGNA